MSNFCMTFISKVLVFLNFVYNLMGASSTGSVPTTIYILMHNFIILYRAGFNLSLLKRAKKLSLIWYQTNLDMWSIFGVKLNHIVIFEKSCNNSTLLMELFMICGHFFRYNDSENNYETLRFVIIVEEVEGQVFGTTGGQTGKNSPLLLAMVSKCSSSEYN